MSWLRLHVDDRPVREPHADDTGRPQTDAQDYEPASSIEVVGQCDESFPASGSVLARGSAPPGLEMDLIAGEEEIPPSERVGEEEVLHIRVGFRRGGKVVVELVFEFLDDGRP